jgi:hypothetical protein
MGGLPARWSNESALSYMDDAPNDGPANAMAITAASDAIDLSPSSTNLSGLDGINFFLAGMQAGFGPFVAVLLADEKWTQQNTDLC